MIKRITILAFLACAAPAWADCDTSAIELALAAPLTDVKPSEFDVSDISSTEGGAWAVFREKDGRLNSIIRTDYGESGRRESRLSVVDRNTYGIALTRVEYLRHAFIEEAGPNGTARRSTDYYYFCGGKLYLPGSSGATMDMETYPQQATTALVQMRDHADIAKFTIGLKR